MAGKKRKKYIRGPESIWDNFNSNMESIWEFVSTVEPIALAHDRKRASTRPGSLVDVLDEVKRLGGKIGFNKQKRAINITVPKGTAPEPIEEKLRELTKTGLRKDISIEQADMLYRSSFVMLNSFFDYLISDIIHCYYDMYPESLSDKEL